jgi:hypothetical protein
LEEPGDFKLRFSARLPENWKTFSTRGRTTRSKERIPQVYAHTADRLRISYACIGQEYAGSAPAAGFLLVPAVMQPRDAFVRYMLRAKECGTDCPHEEEYMANGYWD